MLATFKLKPSSGTPPGNKDLDPFKNLITEVFASSYMFRLQCCIDMFRFVKEINFREAWPLAQRNRVACRTGESVFIGLQKRSRAVSSNRWDFGLCRLSQTHILSNISKNKLGSKIMLREYRQRNSSNPFVKISVRKQW